MEPDSTDLHRRILEGGEISDAEWHSLIPRMRKVSSETRASAQEIVEGVPTPPGYRFNLPSLARFGRIVFSDPQPKTKQVLLVKFGHSSEDEIKLMVRDRNELSRYVRCQDATFDALCSVSEEDPSTAFVMEPYDQAGTQWNDGYQETLRRLRAHDTRRRERGITDDDLSSILQGPYASQAFRCLGAGERFAAFLLEKGRHNRIFPGRNIPIADYRRTDLTNLAIRPQVPDEEIQAIINRWLLTHLKNDAIRHRFMREQADLATRDGARLIILYGSSHTDKGSNNFSSYPPIDAYLQDYQLSILEPYGAAAPPPPSVICMENLQVNVVQEWLRGARARLGQIIA